MRRNVDCDVALAGGVAIQETVTSLASSILVLIVSIRKTMVVDQSRILQPNPESRNDCGTFSTLRIICMLKGT